MSVPRYRAAIAANRFGMGAKQGELSDAAQGEQEWLKQQFVPPYFDKNLPNTIEAIALIGQIKEQRAARRAKEAGKQTDEGMMAMQPVNAKPIRLALATDSVLQSISSKASFSWRLLHFFSNHFSVTNHSIDMSLLSPLLEREAIAPNLYKRFEDMLIAVVRHPAMLVYLNNERSVGPNSKIAQRKKHRGLNENLAREILELHTLGVNGGYNQQDIIELAKAISGWSVARHKNKKEMSGSGFQFRPNGYEPGERRILGKVYLEAGAQQGEQVLRDLARHASTAHFVCTKIARHFSGDVPAESLVKRLTRTWMKTGGDLSAIYTALIESPELWVENPVKFKTPLEFFVSANRAFNINNIEAKTVVRVLKVLGQAPFSAGSPAGYPDIASAWDGSDALFARIEWSALAAKRVRNANPLKVGKEALGAVLTQKTHQALRRAESQQQAVALLLMSPEFQRR